MAVHELHGVAGRNRAGGERLAGHAIERRERRSRSTATPTRAESSAIRRATAGSAANGASITGGVASTARQRFITTLSPPSWAIRPASRLAMPSWSQRHVAPTATASRACSGQAGGSRKTSTISTGPVAATAAASVG